MGSMQAWKARSREGRWPINGECPKNTESRFRWGVRRCSVCRISFRPGPSKEPYGMSVSAEILAYMQSRVANASVSASALRGSKKGTIDAVRCFLRGLKLESLKALPLPGFERWHAKLVDSLMKTLSRKGLSPEYGRCVKAVNLFLRDATCHHHLRQVYHLDRLEHLLHIPVDEKVAYELQSLTPPGVLPGWTGVMYLTKINYNKYQKRAQEIATIRHTFRVFLDDEFWSRPKSDRPTPTSSTKRSHATRRDVSP